MEKPQIKVKGGSGCLVWAWLLFFQWVPRWLEVLVVLFTIAAVENVFLTAMRLLSPKEKS